MSKKRQHWVEKMGFDNEQQYNDTWETARTRQKKLVDKSIDALNLSGLNTI